MTFKEFYYYGEVPEQPRQYSDMEIANLYFQGGVTVREIARQTEKSVGEVYRVIRNFGEPNRRSPRHDTVLSLADSGMGVRSISDMTGYTTRHVRNILKKQG